MLATQVVTGADSETWQYDDAGNVTSHLDSDGDTTESYYNGDGEMTEQFVVYNASTTTTASWDYDDDGNVETQVDALSRTTVYDYDDNADVTEEIDAAGSSVAATTFSRYDKDGNMTEESTPTVGTSGTAGYEPAIQRPCTFTTTATWKRCASMRWAKRRRCSPTTPVRADDERDRRRWPNAIVWL